MYLSRVQLKNWRSYADATFSFKRPTSRRPLVLIGAMNGHGKTSFLVSLYLGLFGRFGLRYCEGFDTFRSEDAPFYRKAVQQFRRNSSPADEPTTIELVFTPTLNDHDEEEIRIVRRWYFTGTNQPKQGDAFEEVDLYIDGKATRLLSGLDAAVDRVEKYLFPAHVMPAFFFDGEQAQTLINNAGEQGIKKAVEVMFGTKVIEDLGVQIAQYLNNARQKNGGKRQTSEKQRELDQKIAQRAQLNALIADRQTQSADLESQRETLERERRAAQEELSKLGGSKAHDIKLIQEAMVRAEHEKEAAEKAVTDAARSLGICLAVSRLAPAIVNRLEAEDLREKWERLREGAIDRSEQVIAVAMPEPASTDPLLGNIASETRSQVKDRFRKALEHIYNPPPTNCASEYLLGHVKGELRQKAMGILARTRRLGSADIRNKCQRLKLARDAFEDAVARNERLRDLPKEIEAHSERLNGLNAQIAEAIKRLGAADHEVKKLKGDHHSLSAEIGRLQEEVAKSEPEQRRIAVAERVSRVLEELTEKLKPITINRLEESVTTHFIAIADKRFRGGRVRIPREGAPVFESSDKSTQPIESMSGFERRSFGIAFSLALAEITKRRIPLIIDTPMGNADTAYRPRLLKAVTNVDLDQVIILTHDAEVAGNLLDAVEDQVCQEFLVKYDPENKESVVQPDAYFEKVYA